jgi:hypothetical protein
MKKLILLIQLVALSAFGAAIPPQFISIPDGPIASGGGSSGPPELALSATNSVTSSSATITTSLTIPADANRLLVVALCYYPGGGATDATATWNGTALTQTYSTNFYDTSGKLKFFHLIAPAATTANLVFTATGGTFSEAGLNVCLYTNVNQTTPVTVKAATFKAEGSGPNVSETVTGTTTEKLVSICGTYAISPTAVNMTKRGTTQPGNGSNSSASLGDVTGTGSSVTLTWNQSSSTYTISDIVVALSAP